MIADATVAGAIAEGRKRLLVLVRRSGGSALDAEDVLHTAVARALERADQLRDPARVEAWLARIVRNSVMDELRRRGRPTALDQFATQSPPQSTPPCDCVLAQLEQMPPARAAILRRVVLEDVPLARVAAELGITMNAAMVRLHRARAALVHRLSAHCGTTSLRDCAGCGCDERGCC